jgi:hypothetical protein
MCHKSIDVFYLSRGGWNFVNIISDLRNLTEICRELIKDYHRNLFLGHGRLESVRDRKWNILVRVMLRKDSAAGNRLRAERERFFSSSRCALRPVQPPEQLVGIWRSNVGAKAAEVWSCPLSFVGYYCICSIGCLHGVSVSVGAGAVTAEGYLIPPQLPW